jgi:GT2 family glycosyltransferase
VFGQDCGNFEVIVVDNGSADGTAAMVDRDFPAARLIRNASNTGACAARNQAIAASTGEYLWFLDSDSEAANPRCLANMLSLMAADPGIGSIGGEIHRDEAEKEFVRIKSVLGNGETVNHYVPMGEATKRDCDYLATCNCLVRRQHLVEWGGFDEDYFVLSEDKELGLYLKSRGLRNVADASTVAYHHISPGSGRRSLFLKLRNMVRFSILHAPLWRLPFLPFLDVFYLFRGTKFQDLKAGTPHAVKYLDAGQGTSARRKGAPFPLRLALAGTRYLVALAGAYLWNLAHLPTTVCVRRARPNFIQRHLACSSQPTRVSG